MSDQATTVEQEMEPEQASELAALQRMAAAETQTDSAQETAPEPNAVPLAVEISSFLTMIVGFAKPMFPSLGHIYTEETINQVGKALEPVCVKRGWLAGGIGGAYAEEVMAVCMVAPLAFATYGGIQADIAARKKATQIENVPAIPLGQQTGVTPDAPTDTQGLQMGQVIPHENS